ncbi:MAG TPA: translocation/assembly module TamB domain-containing protein [Rhizomicrobium sp.]|jgi:translocation and assembly module TamB
MRRWIKRIAWTVAAVIGTPVLAALLLYASADTGLGRSAIESLVSFFSGGDVTIAGLDGSFPYTPRVGHVEIRDAKGVWLTADGVAVEWSPWGALSGNIQVTSARAARIRVLRLPVSSSTDNTPATTRYEIGSLIVDRADFAAGLIGHPVSIALRARGHYTNGRDAQWVLSAVQLGGTGHYDSEGLLNANTITAKFDVREPVHGLLAGLAGLPDLGPLTIAARIDGPRQAEVLDTTIYAGDSVATAKGSLDLIGRTADLNVIAHAASMAPRPDLSWEIVAFDGRVHGSFARPEAQGRLSIDALKVAGASVQAIEGDLSGNGGAVRFAGEADGVRLPGRAPGMLASAPLKFSVDARLDGKAPVVAVAATHPLIALNGTATLAEHTTANASLKLARLAPFAGIAGIDLDGDAALSAQMDLQPSGNNFAVNGTINGAGPSLLSRLLGRGAQIALVATTDKTGFAVKQAHIASKTVTLDANGAQRNAVLDFSYRATMLDVSQLAKEMVGRFTSQGRIWGTPQKFSATANAQGTLATKGYATGPVTVALDAQNLPSRAQGTLEVNGRLDTAPLRLSALFDPRGADTHHVELKTLTWRSLQAAGDLVIPHNVRAITAHTQFRIGQLADVAMLIGQKMEGAVQGVLDIAPEGGRTVARIKANASALAIQTIKAGSLTAEGRIADPFGKPDLSLSLKAGGLSLAGATGDASVQADGPLNALHVSADGNFKHQSDAIPLTADATLDLTNSKATLAILQTDYRGAPFRLTAPAHVDFAGGFAVDRLQIASKNALIDISGRIAPALSLDVSLRNASPELIRIFVPSLDAEGSISGDARLSGSLDAPSGTVAVQANNFHLRGAASGLPPATITANGTLHGQSMTLVARIDAGKKVHLSLNGTVPLQESGTFDLKADGTTDIQVINPMLAANGRRVRGAITLDGHFTGNLANPRASGTATLTDGTFVDLQQGIRVKDVTARVEATGDTVTVSELTGHAGNGTISAHGTVALWADGIPVALTVTLQRARPIATDLFTADLDANLKVTGNLRDTLTLSGTAHVDNGEINIAESYPPEVAVLDVRHSRAQPAPPPPPKPLGINLDLAITTTNQIFIRGRGLDAQASGTLAVKGSSSSPIVTGGFTMRRGSFNLGGQTLDFNSGKITFDGQSINGSFDPALDFDAQSTSGSVTAKLQVTGHASAPIIVLSSNPTLPQDEVLAHLLFGQSVAQLNAVQLAQIAQAFAAIGGIGSGFNPLGSLRKSLGLDRLAVGSSTSGNGAAIEAGKNFGNVYVGARQDTGGGTQAVVQVDLTEHLKLQSTVTAVASAAPTQPTATPQENGTAVGVIYEFEY